MRTYGSASLLGKQWYIKLEPHVAIRFKRMFAQIKSTQIGEFMMTDTIEAARDLAWFVERYPVVMDGATEEHLRMQVDRHTEQTSMVDALLAGTLPPSPVELARPLRAYQQVAAELAFVKRRMLLGDDVGLGKTSTAIGLIARAECRPAVVVTLTHLPRQWEAEIQTVAPSLRTHIIKKRAIYDIGTTGRKNHPSLLGTPDVILISYSKLDAWAETLGSLVKTVIFDEVQELRHRGTSKFAGGSHLSKCATYAMGLSATPFYNYGGEMWSVMDCVSPDSLGTHDEFSTAWCKDNWQDGKLKIKDPKAFGMHLRDAGLMLRRTRKDVERELPPISKIPQLVESDKATLDKLTENCASLADALLNQTERFRGEKMKQSEEFSMLLRQATGVAKAAYVAEFVRLLVESGEKVVLYGWHREVYKIWREKLNDLRPALYSGSESVNQKEEAKQRFITGDTNVLIISLRSGAGLDGLQHVCRTVVIGELDWSPGVIEQCIGRVARDGQTDPVSVYYMLSDCGADPFMSEVLGLKRQQIEGLRNGEEDLIEELQVDGGHIRRMAAAYLEKHGFSMRFLDGAHEEVAA